MDGRLTRASLLRAAGAAAAALGLGRLGGRSDDAFAGDSVSCVLTPEQTEGPYYIAKEKLRRNITDGRPGTPLTLRLAVVDAKTCRPIKGAAVDIWHCDASGIYSGFGAGRASRTFMRGIQRTNAQRRRDVQDRLSGLVPGPHGAHPRQGARPRQRRPHGPALLPGSRDRRRVRESSVHEPPEPGRAKRRRHGLPQRRQALAPERSPQRCRISSGRSGWASAAPDHGWRRAPRRRIRALGLAGRAPGLARGLRRELLVTSTVVESGGRWRSSIRFAPPEDEAEIWERLDAKPPTMAVILKPDHVRDVDLFAHRYDLRGAYGPYLFWGGDAPRPELEGLEPDRELPGGLVTLYDGRGRNETPLWLPEQRALVFADALTAPGGELRVWGTPWHEKRALPALRRAARAPVRARDRLARGAGARPRGLRTSARTASVGWVMFTTRRDR